MGSIVGMVLSPCLYLWYLTAHGWFGIAPEGVVFNTDVISALLVSALVDVPGGVACPCAILLHLAWLGGGPLRFRIGRLCGGAGERHEVTDAQSAPAVHAGADCRTPTLWTASARVQPTLRRYVSPDLRDESGRYARVAQ